jgi:hypothetical protein
VAQGAQPALSRLHSKFEPSSLEAKTNLAEVDVVFGGGPLEIEVWGGVASAGTGGGATETGEREVTTIVVSPVGALAESPLGAAPRLRGGLLTATRRESPRRGAPWPHGFRRGARAGRLVTGVSPGEMT